MSTFLKTVGIFSNQLQGDELRVATGENAVPDGRKILQILIDSIMRVGVEPGNQNMSSIYHIWIGMICRPGGNATRNR